MLLVDVCTYQSVGTYLVQHCHICLCIIVIATCLLKKKFLALVFAHCMCTFQKLLLAFSFCIIFILACFPANHSLFTTHEASWHATLSNTKGRLKPKKVVNGARNASPATHTKRKMMCPFSYLKTA